MKSGRRSCLLGLGSAALIAGMPFGRAQAAGESFPERPVKFVVPYPAGGGADMAARTVSVPLASLWKQSVVIDNRTGAGGMIGNEFVSKAPADGYTLLLGITSMVQWPFLYERLPYDPKKDFMPVAQLGAASNLFVVPSGVRANSVQDFINLVRAQPGTFSYGSFGNGSTSHIQGETFRRQTGLDMVHVPYNGSTPLINAVLGGQVSLAFIDVGTAKPLLESGRFKALAVTGTRRVKSLPQVATLKELGFDGFEPYGWWGVFVRSGTPKAIVSKLSTDIVEAMRKPEVVAWFESRDLFAIGSGSDEFAKTLVTDAAVWEKAIRDSGIRLN
ncbi:MAG: hypothetical protein A2710_23665 [Burkholderiales bacterium RIFCSPHIGHO2_01_FULL_64_960]|nr:MAG: hypothetical protein A2710_23665 [Burkholderiales bacterium RIFCSPHIGHO2_01_FULL_64_960]